MGEGDYVWMRVTVVDGSYLSLHVFPQTGTSLHLLTLLPGTMRGRTMLIRSSAYFTLTCSARQ